MTLQEAKEKLANDNGNVSWQNYKETWRSAFPESAIDAVAEEYARSKWDEACVAQKELCSNELFQLCGIPSEAPKPEFKP